MVLPMVRAFVFKDKIKHLWYRQFAFLKNSRFTHMEQLGIQTKVTGTFNFQEIRFSQKEIHYFVALV